MRQHLANLTAGLLVGGCSLIYNPNNIDRPPADATDVPVDVEIRADAMPADLELEELFPTTIYEGAGNGGSRPAIVILRGKQFTKDPSGDLTVTLAPEVADLVTLDSFEVSGNGDYIALAITAAIAADCAGTSVPIIVTVAQDDGMGGTVSKSLDTALSLACLPELTAPVESSALADLYSKVEVTGNWTFTPGAMAAETKPAIIRSMSSISIDGAITASAMGRNAGPGGGPGGQGGSTAGGAATKGDGPGGGGGGSGALGADGGGAGFAGGGTAGGGNNGGSGGSPAGDMWISTYDTNRSSGGGGGANNATVAGGIGGGGGGTIELTAPGDVKITGDIATSGAAGASTSLAGDGGAGSGGVVLIRAGNLLEMQGVSVAKGPQSGSGASSDGRIRVDAATGDYPTGTVTRGPMFIDVPAWTTNQTPTITLRGTQSDNTSTLRVYDKLGNAVAGMTYQPVFGTNGLATVTPVLKAGYNKMCVWVAGGDPTVPESVNCVELGYLPL
jgi:hypothetical protein